MFELIYRLLGFRSSSSRYGTRIDLNSLEDGDIRLRGPSPESARTDYFAENSPSASRAQYGQEPISDPYFNGQEEVAANGATVMAVLLIVVAGAIALYAFNPAIHLQVNTLLHR